MSSHQKDSLIQALILQFRYVSVNSVLFSQAISDKAGIHPTDNECLDLLLLNGSMTAGQLADLTGLTTGAVTAMLDRLEKAGFAHRERDPTDRRKVNVVPDLDKINATLTPSAMHMGQALFDICADYSEAELEVVLRLVSAANAAVPDVIKKVRG